MQYQHMWRLVLVHMYQAAIHYKHNYHIYILHKTNQAKRLWTYTSNQYQHQRPHQQTWGTQATGTHYVAWHRHFAREPHIITIANIDSTTRRDIISLHKIKHIYISMCMQHSRVTIQHSDIHMMIALISNIFYSPN